MPDDSATIPTDLAAPITPTGNGPADLEIARQEDELADALRPRAPTDYWQRHAELHRKHDDDHTGPNEPSRLPTIKTADGELGDIIDQWSALPDDERPRYVIHLGGGSLSNRTMEALRAHPRDAAP